MPSPLKEGIHVLGVDDAAFTWTDRTVPLVGVATRGGYVDGVLRADVTVDGHDATDRVRAMIEESRFHGTLHAVMLDGIAFGGFNVVDVPALAAALALPVLTVTKGAPDMTAVERALRTHHAADADARLALMRSVPSTTVHGEGRARSLTVGYVGCTEREAVALVARATVRGLVPEPVRLAHVIARGVFGRERGTRGGSQSG